MVSGMATLGLLLLLSQSTFVELFMDHPVGRGLLLLAVLAITHLNKTIGIALVFLLAIGLTQLYPRNVVVGVEGMVAVPKAATDSVAATATKAGAAIKAGGSGGGATGDNRPHRRRRGGKAREGFFLIERESMMRRGENSNDVFVRRMELVNDVLPSEADVFTNLVSLAE